MASAILFKLTKYPPHSNLHDAHMPLDMPAGHHPLWWQRTVANNITRTDNCPG